MSDNKMVLRATAVTFFSDNDEDSFFKWMGKLPCIVSYEGKGTTLFLNVNPAAVDESSLRELLALFWRYKIDMKQLAGFDREEFTWFRDTLGYWHEAVFG